LVKDIVINLFIRWGQMEKENVVSIEDSMLPEIIRIQTEGFGTKSRNGVKRNIFYFIICEYGKPSCHKIIIRNK